MALLMPFGCRICQPTFLIWDFEAQPTPTEPGTAFGFLSVN